MVENAGMKRSMQVLENKCLVICCIASCEFCPETEGVCDFKGETQVFQPCYWVALQGSLPSHLLLLSYLF